MLESLSIKNFKSIRDSTAHFPAFGAIVGRNGAGKTNLIQCIEFIRSLAGGETTTEFQKGVALIPEELVNHNLSSPDSLIDAIFTIGDDRYRFTVETALRNGGNRPKELNIIKERLELLSDAEKEIIYLRDQGNLYNKTNDLIPIALDPKRLALSLYNDGKTALVRNYLSSFAVVPSELDGMRESLGNDTANTLSGLLIRLSHSQPEVYQQFQAIIRKMLPAFSSLVEMASPRSEGSAQQEEQFLILLEEKNLKGKLSLQSVSSGDLKTLFLIAASLVMDPGSTLIIEEIENATHPQRVKDLVDRLHKISHTRDLQILFSTHSPTVINSLASQEVLYAEKKATSGSKFTLLSEAKDSAKIAAILEKGGELTEVLDAY